MVKLSLRVLLMVSSLLVCAALPADENPKVRLVTSNGVVVIELFASEAPASVENFLAYVESGFYNGTIFHRVISDFMVQGGGFEEGMLKKDPREPIVNESDNELSNQRGTISMARTNAPHSATSQFFINLVDNDFLDFGARGEGEWGYAVFGKIVQGMDVVDQVAQTETITLGPYRDVPDPTIIIESASVDITKEQP